MDGAPIPGGYILLSRKLLESELMSKPPHYLKLWLWLLLKSFWRDGDDLKRGQVHVTIAEMQKAGGYMSGNRKCLLTISEVRNAYGYLVDSGAIITAKTTRGIIVTICNFNKYQSAERYEYPSNIQITGCTPDRTLDDTPDRRDETDVSCESTRKKSTGSKTRTAHRTTRRTNPGPHTIDEEYKRSKNIDKTIAGSSGKSPSEHRLFLEWFCYAFEQIEGDRYFIQGAKEGKLLSTMLTSYSWKELVAKACHYFLHADRFPKGRPTIAGLCSSINRYPSYVDGKAELFRARGLIPPEGIQLEEWLPWRSSEKNRKNQEESAGIAKN